MGSEGQPLRLTDLVKENRWNDMEITGPADTDITGLTADSRNVQPGFLFAAFDGEEADGRTFISDAITRGARTILAPKEHRARRTARASPFWRATLRAGTMPC